MPRSRAFRVTLYFTEAAKHNVDRMWNSLMALDCAIIEEHERAGSAIAEWDRDCEAELLAVPGVAAVTIRPRLEEVEAEVVPLPVAKKVANGRR